MPPLSVVETPSPELEERQGDEAWTHVLDGYERALAAVPPGHPERDHLLRCRSLIAEAMHDRVSLREVR